MFRAPGTVSRVLPGSTTHWMSSTSDGGESMSNQYTSSRRQFAVKKEWRKAAASLVKTKNFLFYFLNPGKQNWVALLLWLLYFYPDQTTRIFGKEKCWIILSLWLYDYENNSLAMIFLSWSKFLLPASPSFCQVVIQPTHWSCGRSVDQSI